MTSTNNENGQWILNTILVCTWVTDYYPKSVKLEHLIFSRKVRLSSPQSIINTNIRAKSLSFDKFKVSRPKKNAIYTRNLRKNGECWKISTFLCMEKNVDFDQFLCIIRHLWKKRNVLLESVNILKHWRHVTNISNQSECFSMENGASVLYLEILVCKPQHKQDVLTATNFQMCFTSVDRIFIRLS